MLETIYHYLNIQAQNHPAAIALIAAGRAPLTYSRLLAQIEEVVGQLQAMGLSHPDRVAVVLPNGPEMAVAFLAIAAGTTCAPLNPAYRQEEFDFYLSDLGAKVLIVQQGVAEAARKAARERGIAIVELCPSLAAAAGIFSLSADQPPSAISLSLKFSQPDDVALVLHTSGTTARPKIVPLTQQNLCTSAQNIRTALQLTSSDRALNVMPLFHIHGLVGVLLSSLRAGASVVCTPGCDAPKFFDWLAEFQPTWYSAVPTMHQSIIARAQSNVSSIASSSLRLIRSSSAALPPQLMAELENIFGVPAIESYGMTEASHQMASNPLPPGQRKPGSVGMAAGPEVAIMDEAGNLLLPQETGEVVIRGANVTQGYDNNPQANANSMTKGWFRTGDLGYLDAESYLFLKGRIKEIINRGGEKISPREVDEVLLAHPAIEQVVTFAAPHNLLGEEVAAAVVLVENASATEQEIKTFAAQKLADFKVPRVIVFVPQIPKGPTGKLQRIGLAEKLGLIAAEPAAPRSELVSPRTSIEAGLADIWSAVLRVNPIGIYDNFFQLGGDSLLAAQIANRIREIWQVELPFVFFFGPATLAEMAIKIAQTQAEMVESVEMSELLDALESLSDEEVQHLLKEN
jgi:oxalate---CoA ligase